MYLVVWSQRIGPGPDDLADHWVAVESRKDAYLKYAELLELDSTYIASVCVPVVSTDYDTVKV
jgi:hypothetical protein